MQDKSFNARNSALTSASVAPAKLQQKLSGWQWRLKYHLTILSFTCIYVLYQSWFHSPSPDSSKCRLCVSVPSYISKVYLPSSFSVGFEISIHTFCMLLPGLVLASWSILFSLQEQDDSQINICSACCDGSRRKPWMFVLDQSLFPYSYN